MILKGRDRELVSVGASVACGCQRCVEVHVKEARTQGASEEEIARSMNTALHVREDAHRIMKEHGLRVIGRKLMHLARTTGNGDAGRQNDPPGTWIDELTAVAAAFAVNCDESLEQHSANARAAGATEEQILESVRISRFIKGKADSLCCKRI